MAKRRRRKELDKPRGFVAEPCPNQTCARGVNENFTRVWRTVGHVRYVRCSCCGMTWKQTVSAEFRSSTPQETQPKTE